MIIKTKEFQAVANKILPALGADKRANMLELHTGTDALFLSVSNAEFYVSVKFQVELPEVFRVVVDAQQFLTLISGITTEEFTLDVHSPKVTIKSGKSKYDLAVIMENDRPMELPVIDIKNKTVEMTISEEILSSILNINSKEIAKNKSIDASELRKMYYIDQGGCFTFATGSACLNAFTLEKPIKLLLNDRVVKLFKLFDKDVHFSFGYDKVGQMTQTKISLETDDIFVSARITNDDLLLAKVEHPCEAAKQMMSENYPNKLVIDVAETSAAIGRLIAFIKNSVDDFNAQCTPATFKFTPGELAISDQFGNTEVVSVNNESYLDADYEMVINLQEVKTILDSSKVSHVTLNCGNKRTVCIVRGAVSNLISEFVVG